MATSSLDTASLDYIPFDNYELGPEEFQRELGQFYFDYQATTVISDPVIGPSSHGSRPNVL